jgi:hypothetical protein
VQQNPYAPPAGSPSQIPPQPGGALQPPLQVSAWASVKFAFSSNVGFGNLLLGLLLLIIPIIGPILLAGWHAETHRRLVRREFPSVRGFEFGEFTNYLMAGLVPFVAQMAVTMVAMFPLMFVMGIVAAVAVPIVAEGGGSPIALAVMGLFGAALMFVVTALMIVLVTSMLVRAELTGNFNRTFDLPAVWRFMGRRWQALLGYSLLLGLIAMPLMLLGLLAFFVGIYVVVVAIQFAQVHLRWQIYEADVRAGGEVLAIHPGNGADI